MFEYHILYLWTKIFDNTPISNKDYCLVLVAIILAYETQRKALLQHYPSLRAHYIASYGYHSPRIQYETVPCLIYQPRFPMISKTPCNITPWFTICTNIALLVLSNGLLLPAEKYCLHQSRRRRQFRSLWTQKYDASNRPISHHEEDNSHWFTVNSFCSSVLISDIRNCSCKQRCSVVGLGQ